MKKKVFTSLGLMTGTSMDGVDLSIIKSDGYSEFTAILDKYYEFDDDLRKKLTDLRRKINISSDLNKYSDELRLIEKKLTIFHTNIVSEVLNKHNHNVDLVGFHGQTIFHNSQEKISIQLGDGKLLSQMIKKIVINNFRQNDLENNGQGAPLTPIFHQLISNILSKKNKIQFPINIINIGGISNITQIIKNDQTKSFDLNAYPDKKSYLSTNEEYFHPIGISPNSDFSKGIKIIVKEKFEEGLNEKEIKEFLTTRYCEYILFKPYFNSKNLVLWLFPFILVIISMLALIKTSKKTITK